MKKISQKFLTTVAGMALVANVATAQTNDFSQPDMNKVQKSPKGSTHKYFVREQLNDSTDQILYYDAPKQEYRSLIDTLYMPGLDSAATAKAIEEKDDAYFQENAIIHTAWDTLVPTQLSYQLRVETPKDSTGTEKGFYPGGELQYTKPLVDGKVEGVIEEYQENGALRGMATYKNDILEGTLTECDIFDEDLKTNVDIVTNFKKGWERGLVRFYKPDGELVDLYYTCDYCPDDARDPDPYKMFKKSRRVFKMTRFWDNVKVALGVDNRTYGQRADDQVAKVTEKLGLTD